MLDFWIERLSGVSFRLTFRHVHRLRKHDAIAGHLWMEWPLTLFRIYGVIALSSIVVDDSIVLILSTCVFEADGPLTRPRLKRATDICLHIHGCIADTA